MKGKKRYFMLLFVALSFFSLYIIFISIYFDCEQASYLKLTSLFFPFSSWCKSSHVLTHNLFFLSASSGTNQRKSYTTLVTDYFNITLDEENKRSRSFLDIHKTSEHSKFKFLSNCRMSNCFDVSRCKPGEKVKIHIYPEVSKVDPSNISPIYQKILNIIESSSYYEPDFDKACLYLPRYDYLDRDHLSTDFKTKNPPTLLKNGINHIIFNLFSGTYPAYSEIDMSGFSLGKAIFIKASFSYLNYRPGFDISFPLFSKTHPERGSTWLSGSTVINEIPSEENKILIGSAQELIFNNGNKNLLVFKGKRYTYGRGSETRNSLYHLHNHRDILMFTTCKHGTWKQVKDERCLKDNIEYEKCDYKTLMSNSVFCLVPRGRRLGSFRFLEALSFGCIPVILSNHWVKPFEEVIDWSEAAVAGDERSLLQVPEILRSIPRKRVEKMRSQTIAIYETYFSSIEKIVHTTLAILSQRIQTHLSLTSFLWNLVNPGFTTFTSSLWFDKEYSLDIGDYPGYRQLSNSFSSSLTFTAVIYTNRLVVQSSVSSLIKEISQSLYLSKIIILWCLENKPPKLPCQVKNIKVEVIIPKVKSIHAKLFPYTSIKTDAVLSLDIASNILAEELDFAFLVWCSFPHRIVGFTARDHYFDRVTESWVYTSKWTNQYSIILLESAFYHRYYNHLYTVYMSSNIMSNFELDDNLSTKNSSKKSPTDFFDGNLCLDLAFNFLVSHVTREGPIKVSQRKTTLHRSNGFDDKYLEDPFSVHQKCFQLLSEVVFSYIPLVKSQMRFDPLLYKDEVLNVTKKYPNMEKMI